MLACRAARRGCGFAVGRFRPALAGQGVGRGVCCGAVPCRFVGGAVRSPSRPGRCRTVRGWLVLIAWLATDRRWRPGHRWSAGLLPPVRFGRRSASPAVTTRSVGRTERFASCYHPFGWAHPPAGLPLPPVRLAAGSPLGAVTTHSFMPLVGAAVTAPPIHGHPLRTMAYPFTDPPLGSRTTHSQILRRLLARPSKVPLKSPGPACSGKTGGYMILGNGTWPFHQSLPAGKNGGERPRRGGSLTYLF